MDDSKRLKSIDDKLSALIALNALIAFGKGEDQRIEVVLSRAGLQNADIAKVLGKALPAVQKALQRARK